MSRGFAYLDMPLSVYAFSTSWCPSDMYIKLHLCRVLEASGSIIRGKFADPFSYLSRSTSIEPEASSTLQRCSFMYMSMGHHDVLDA